MLIVEEMIAEAGGMRVLLGGGGGESVVLLHGTAPAITPYCGGAHLWDRVLPIFALDRKVAALDLPGCGGTPIGPQGYDLLAVRDRIATAIDALALGPCHLVGHDQGGVLALLLALLAPNRVRSVTVVAGASAAPTGEGMPNFALLQTPKPLWSRQSQAVVLERLSYSRHHLGGLIDRCVACEQGAGHRSAVKLAQSGNYGETYASSAAKAKMSVFVACRDGLPIPVQIIWGSHDPMTRVEEGLTLFQTFADRQPRSQFHVINRAGALPFHEEAEAFHAIVAAFQDGVSNEGS